MIRSSLTSLLAKEGMREVVDRPTGMSTVGLFLIIHLNPEPC